MLYIISPFPFFLLMSPTALPPASPLLPLPSPSQNDGLFLKLLLVCD